MYYITRRDDEIKLNSSINLHIHTTYSDGGNTPAEVVAMLKSAGVTAFSITDHDKVAGNIEAAALAKKHGLNHISHITYHPANSPKNP